jgi:hypothetical protein
MTSSCPGSQSPGAETKTPSPAETLRTLINVGDTEETSSKTIILGQNDETPSETLKIDASYLPTPLLRVQPPSPPEDGPINELSESEVDLDTVPSSAVDSEMSFDPLSEYKPISPAERHQQWLRDVAKRTRNNWCFFPPGQHRYSPAPPFRPNAGMQITPNFIKDYSEHSSPNALSPVETVMSSTDAQMKSSTKPRNKGTGDLDATSEDDASSGVPSYSDMFERSIWQRSQRAKWDEDQGMSLLLDSFGISLRFLPYSTSSYIYLLPLSLPYPIFSFPVLISSPFFL